ncbi:hypothetical protein, partial [Frankia sp. AgKG'84/4]|uniref:hypothetical protein n=1 Tax=Frankia sp. AgKG'84/4 TaxID=573490 RepID=UPI002029BDB6
GPERGVDTVGIGRVIPADGSPAARPGADGGPQATALPNRQAVSENRTSRQAASEVVNGR